MGEDEFYTPIESEILDSIANEEIEAHDDISYGDRDSDSDAIDAVADDSDLENVEFDDSDREDIGEDY